MAQSESRYIQDKFGRLSAEACRNEGELARAAGLCSAENPFLDRTASHAQGGSSEQDWFFRCDAWWRGWDARDLRLRESSSLRRVSPLARFA
jgi:hypothetical protein